MMAGMGLREKTATQCCKGVFGHMSQGTRQRDTAGRAQLRFEKTRVGPLRGPKRRAITFEPNSVCKKCEILGNFRLI